METFSHGDKAIIPLAVCFCHLFLVSRYILNIGTLVLRFNTNNIGLQSLLEVLWRFLPFSNSLYTKCGLYGIMIKFDQLFRKQYKKLLNTFWSATMALKSPFHINPKCATHG